MLIFKEMYKKYWYEERRVISTLRTPIQGNGEHLSMQEEIQIQEIGITKNVTTSYRFKRQAVLS